MKVFILNFGIVFCCFLAINTTYAQVNTNLKPIEFEGRKAMYDGKKIKKPAEFAAIVYAANDPESTNLMQDYMQKRKLSQGVMIAGTGIGVVGLIVQGGAIGEDNLSSISNQSNKGVSIVLSGMAVLLTGLVMDRVVTKKTFTPAIDRYNQLTKGKNRVTLDIIPANQAIGLGVGLRF